MIRTPRAVTLIRTRSDLDSLRSFIADPGRKYPTVVVADDSTMDVDHIAQRLPLCDVFWVPRQFIGDVVPARWVALSMIGHTARVFPGDNVDWRNRPDQSRFFRGEVTEEQVVEAALETVPGQTVRRQANRKAAAGRAVSREAEQQVVWIRSLDGVHAMAERLLDADRAKPVAVITVIAGQSRPVIDPDAVLAAAPDEVEVYVLPEQQMTFILADQVGRASAVYGGAGRVYGLGTGWLHNPYSSRLHLVDTAERARAATDRMIGDVLRETDTARWMNYQRASADHRPDPAQPITTITYEPLQHYRRGDIVLARVRTVDASAASLELFPQVQTHVPLSEITGNDLDRIDDLMSVGEVVGVRITERPEVSGNWRVTMLDIDDDESIQTAPPVRPGGDPWISLSDNDDLDPLPPPDAQDDRLEPAPEPTPPSPLPGPATVVRRDERITALEQELTWWKTETSATKRDVVRYYEMAHSREQELQAVRTRARKIRGRESADPTSRTVLFQDAEQQFRWEIFTTWAKMIPAAEKHEAPLPDYAIGPDFLPSVAALQSPSVKKTLKAVVYVLLNRATGAHPLRHGEAGTASRITHDDAVCMRFPIEDDTPSSRRLHYWRGPEGRTELSKIGIHDDYTSGALPTFIAPIEKHTF